MINTKEIKIMMKILEPITIAGVKFKNRLLLPPLTTSYEEKDGSISSQSKAYYTRLAKGGVGYIVLGDVAPIRSFAPTPKLYDDSQIESFRSLCESVHNYDTKIGVQIFHPEYDVDVINQMFANGEQDQVRARLHHDMEHFVNEVSEEKLQEIIAKMCDCAIRAEKAGVDVIQIHGDRLVGSLCSTKMNSRTDQFGGSLENRTRYALMVVDALKKAVPNMIIEYKLAVVTPERGKGGIDEADAPQFAKWLEEAGVHMLHVAQANHTGNLADTIPPMGIQPYSFFADITGKVKQAVSIPVSTSGRIIDPEMAEGLLQDNKADMIGLGRALIADPDWINKAAAGNNRSIRRCISCNECVDSVMNRKFMICAVNAETGYEQSRSITPAAVKKNVVVIGAGVAGLEAARVAAKKGHHVTLFEKEKVIGGQINIADVPPRKIELDRATEDLANAIQEEGVSLRLGEAASVENILALKPDAVIVAVGASNFIPPIKGVDGPNVRDAWKILAGEENVSGKVVIVGGGMVGCETAEFLAEQGCKISIVDMRDKVAEDVSLTILPTMMEFFQTYDVQLLTSHKVVAIEKEHVLCENKDAQSVSVQYDYVVMASGSRSLEFDTTMLTEKGISVYKVGDHHKVSNISKAIKTGYDAANQI